MALFLCQAKGKTHQASASRTVPPSLGNWRGFYRWGSQSGVYDKDQSSEGLAFFFFLHYFKTVIAGIRQLSNWVHLSLVYRPSTFFLKSYRGDLLQGSAENVNTRSRM